MEISHEKSKILVNDPDPNKCNSINLITSMYGKKQEQVKSYQYLRVRYNANSKHEISIRIATVTSIMVRLEMVWRSREISFTFKFNLYNSLIITIFYMSIKGGIFLNNL